MRPKPQGAALPMISIQRKGEKPLHRQIYDSIRVMVLERRLQAGQQIPSTRALAQELGISRIPVLDAYAQLLAEGFIETRSGAGTFVTSSLSDRFLAARRMVQGAITAPAADEISRASAALPVKKTSWFPRSGAFSVGPVAYDHFPFRVWSDLVTRHARRVSTGSMNYSDSMGSEEFREAIATYLQTARAVNCDSAQIMVVSGSQQALDLSARVLLDPDSPVARSGSKNQGTSFCAAR
jgi:GntR family transcriptional regulator/MocR family aminotransferase